MKHWSLLILAAFGLVAAARPAHTLTEQRKPKRIVLVAGKVSHGPGDHEFNAGCTLLKKCLDGVPGVETKLYLSGWPSDPNAFDNADAIFFYMDGGSGHAAIQDDHLKVLDALAKKGVGLGFGHYGVEVPADKGGKEWQDWIGGYYETNFSVNPMWEPDYQTFPNHPITRGVKPFQVRDEWYFNMRFTPDMKGITPILVAKPSDAVRNGPYVAPAGPYPHIQAAKGRDEIMMWAKQREDGGRGFGFTGGHRHVNWGNDNYRRVVLNALLWIAKAPVPRDGVQSTVTADDLKANLDPKGK
jgi:type 1 glutamine amidotransferase